MTDTDPPIRIAALYRFARFDDPAALKPALLGVCEAGGVKGTILLAREGINGTIAGPCKGIEAVLAHVRSLPGCAELEVKFSASDVPPFHRMKVRLKREIVTMNQPELDPVGNVGTYVSPHDWNALIDDPDTLVIDTRNEYEVGIGSFDGAVDPETASFGEFPDWWQEHGAALAKGKRKVAMFCTGGIRCEKSTAFLKAQGVDEVYHLKGGILSYLEHVPEANSRWRGECFVFDERVSVAHGLAVGQHALCRACRKPLSREQLASPHYVEGVSCDHCHAERTDEQRARYAERQRQARLAEERGEAHVGREEKRK